MVIIVYNNIFPKSFFKVLKCKLIVRFFSGIIIEKLGTFDFLMTIKREHKQEVSEPKLSGFTERKRSGKSQKIIKNLDFTILEDSRDLSIMDHLIPEGIHSAYLKAINSTDSIIEVHKGQIGRRLKNGKIEIISRLESPRQVEAGATVTLSK